MTRRAAAPALLGSPAATSAINGVSFLAGAVVVAALPRAAFRRPAAADEPAHATLRDELTTGWRALREHPDALPRVGIEIVASAIYGASTVLFVLLAVRLGLGAGGYGYLLSAMGAGQMISEVGVDTLLQRSLDPAVFARAYGLVVPACVAAIVGGALVAPLAVSLIGLDATLAITGAAVLAYGALAARSRLQHDAHTVGRAQLV